MAEAALIEHELCNNCKKEIPQSNYVMHTAHCTRNFALCSKCKEPVAKTHLQEHVCIKTKPCVRTEPKVEHKSSKSSMKACRYCDLELPHLDLADHESYCGSRTDRCNECGEIVMYKYKKLHEDTNHGFLKLADEPGPRPSWDSTTQRPSLHSEESLYARRARNRCQFGSFDMSSLYDMSDYMPPSLMSGGTRSSAGGGGAANKGETYKDLSRRLDCKTEYIRNLLHDSASITVPLRTSSTAPRNHFNHNKGPAPQPPSSSSRRRNPPTELSVPCEFCGTPIPHQDLVEHETSCRPRRVRAPQHDDLLQQDDDYYGVMDGAVGGGGRGHGGGMGGRGVPESPDEELPCEFCSDMIPASQLLRHQLSCST